MLMSEPSNKAQWEVDRSASFEEVKWPYYLGLPLMWVLTVWVKAKKATYRVLRGNGNAEPKINTIFFDGLGLSCRNSEGRKHFVASAGGNL